MPFVLYYLSQFVHLVNSLTFLFEKIIFRCCTLEYGTENKNHPLPCKEHGLQLTHGSLLTWQRSLSIRFTQSALNLNTGWSHPTTPPLHWFSLEHAAHKQISRYKQLHISILVSNTTPKKQGSISPHWIPPCTFKIQAPEPTFKTQSTLFLCPTFQDHTLLMEPIFLWGSWIRYMALICVNCTRHWTQPPPFLFTIPAPPRCHSIRAASML